MQDLYLSLASAVRRVLLHAGRGPGPAARVAHQRPRAFALSSSFRCFLLSLLLFLSAVPSPLARFCSLRLSCLRESLTTRFFFVTPPDEAAPASRKRGECGPQARDGNGKAAEVATRTWSGRA